MIEVLEAVDVASAVHIVGLDGRCIAAIVTDMALDGRVVVQPFPASGMVMPHAFATWAYDPVGAVSTYHRKGECPRRNR